jgi:chromosome segregation ATPase
MENERLVHEKEHIQSTLQAQQQALEEQEQQISNLKTEQQRLANEKEQIQATVQSQKQELEDKEQQIVQLKAEQERLVHEKEQIQATVQSQKQELEDKEMQVAELRINIASNEQMLKQQSDSLKYAAAEKQQLKQLLEIVHNSLGWRWISKIHSIENKLMPISSYRRNYYDILWKILKTDIFSKSKRHKVRKKKDCRVTK